MFISSWVFLQKTSIEFNIKGEKTEYYINLEKKLKSEPYDTGQTYYSFDKNAAQPLVFLRKEKDLPNLLVYYNFSVKDSIVSEILYEWDVYNFNKGDNNLQSLEFERNLIHKYDEILNVITAEYGKGKTTGSLDDLSKISTANGLKRKDEWRLDDGLKIVMYTAISNYYI
jgi:hypothetical protein